MTAFPRNLRPHWVKSAFTLHGADNYEATRGLGKFIYLSRTFGTMYFSRPDEQRSKWRGVRYMGSGMGVGLALAAPIGGSKGSVDYPLSGDDDFGALFFEHNVPPFLEQLSGCTGELWCPGGSVTAGSYSFFNVSFWDAGRHIAYAWQRGAGVTIGSIAGVSLTKYSIEVTGVFRGGPPI